LIIFLWYEEVDLSRLQSLLILEFCSFCSVWYKETNQTELQKKLNFLYCGISNNIFFQFLYILNWVLWSNSDYIIEKSQSKMSRPQKSLYHTKTNEENSKINRNRNPLKFISSYHTKQKWLNLRNEYEYITWKNIVRCSFDINIFLYITEYMYKWIYTRRRKLLRFVWKTVIWENKKRLDFI